MALVKCFHCGEDYSGRLDACPHCKHTPYVFVCPECGSLYGREDKACINCGVNLENVDKCPANKEEVQKQLSKSTSFKSKSSETMPFRNFLYTVYFADASSSSMSASLEVCRWAMTRR